jgi:hypothetical protein
MDTGHAMPKQTSIMISKMLKPHTPIRFSGTATGG